MKDLKSQLNKGQQAQPASRLPRIQWTKKNIIIAVACGMFALILIFALIFMITFFGKAADRLASDDGTPRYAMSQQGQYGGYSGGFNTTDLTEDGIEDPAVAESPKAFEYGAVAGNNYQSAFSGVKFYAPTDWNVQDHSALGSSSNGTIYDMAATSADGETSVAVIYYPLNSQYKSASSMLNAMKKNTAGEMLNDTVSIRKGGKNFTGYLYTVEQNGTTTYSEVIGTEVNGYIVIIQAKGWTTNQLSAAMSYFK